MRKRSLFAIGSLATLLAAGTFAHRANEGDHARMMDEVRALRDARLARDTSREVPYGATYDGEAWPHYLAAVEALQSTEEFKDRRIAEARLSGAEGKAERDRLLALTDEVLAHLHRGAHAERIGRAGNFELGPELPIQKLTDIRLIGEIATPSVWRSRKLAWAKAGSRCCSTTSSLRATSPSARCSLKR